MSFEPLIKKYAYLALLAGALLEGETLVILAGFAAAQGYLYRSLVILIAFLGTTLPDQT